MTIVIVKHFSVCCSCWWWWQSTVSSM